MSGLGFTHWGASVTIAFGVSFCTIDYAKAQITPDGTLPNSSNITREVDTFNITGGTQAGGNLFHSFGEFSVTTGSTASFNNAVDIQNIISRVTGGSVSSIDGIIRTLGTANLFLINPNGIVFGKDASLNVGGSFVGTTANALQFGNIGFFSATEKNIPSSLLTVNPSALLFNQINQGAAIRNNSVAPAGIDPAGFNAFGLRVPNGKSLLLVGGNVSMDGGKLNAYGGRVELGGLAEPGTVALDVDGDNLSLIFPDNTARTSVSLTNSSYLLVTGASGGNIAVNATNLEILQGSLLSAGIALGLGSPETIGGDITLNATGEIKVAGTGSSVRNLVRLGSLGDGGNITIDSGSFSLGDRAQLAASTFGQGNAGNVTVRAENAVSLADNAAIVSTVESGGVGKGGNININAATLSLLDGARLQTITSGASGNQPPGRGDAGNVNVNVTGAVNIAGEKNGFFSGIRTFVETGTVGNGGDITIDSDSFSLRNGTQLAASTLGQGNAGNVTVRARNAVELVDAAIFSTVESGGVGKGGNINIDAATLSLTDGAQLLTSTSEASANQPAGQGDAGNININVIGTVDIAGEKNNLRSGIRSSVKTGTVGNGGNITIDSGSFSLSDGAVLNALTSGLGNAGNVTVRTRDAVSLADNAAIFSTVEAGGVGNGGNINIDAATLLLIDGAQLQTVTRSASDTQPAGQGDAGDVNINVTGAVDLAGEKNGIVSGIFSFMNTGAVGNGGNITIDSGSLSLRDGTQLSASTYGQGNAGNVIVRARNAVSLADNAGILSTVSAGGVGKGGNIDINAATLSLIDGARLQTITGEASDTQPAGQGDAGDVNVNVTGGVDLAGEKNGIASGIFSFMNTGAVGNGGNITIDSGSLSLRDGAQLEASTYGQGNAGNVIVRARNAVDLVDAAIFSTVSAGGVGKGGNIDINAATLSLIDGAQLQTVTRDASRNQPAGQGDAGDVNVNVTGAVDIAGEKNGFVSGIASLVETGTVGNGGNITINSGSFSLRNGAILAASTSGQGDAGNVTVHAQDVVSLVDNAYILSTVQPGGVGNGGNITIDSGSFSSRNGARLQASTYRQGSAGNVTVHAQDAVSLADNATILSTVDAGGIGKGGDIKIDSGSFSLSNGAYLSASTYGQGSAGNVTVHAQDAVSLADATIFSTVDAGGVGKGGNIDINAATLSLIDGAQLQTITRGASANQPAGRGDAGNVNVKVTGIVDIAGEKNGIASAIGSSVETGTFGNGGSITIDSGSFSLSNGARLEASTSGQGNAGAIKVNAADFFTISGSSSNLNSGLFVNSQSSTGTAGDIIVTSPRVTLDNSGTLNAESASGNGGDINLQTDLLLLRRGAQISTTAGTAEAGGDGGNINIDVPSGFIVAVPGENSDIRANAFTGIGGRVNIKANGIYGIEFRKSPTLLSDITASSEFGTQGTVELNTPDIDPNSGLVQLPTIPVDTQVAQGCYSQDYAQNRFVIAGRGGLPMSPTEPLQDTSTLSAWVRLRPEPANAKTIISPRSTAVSNNTKVAAATTIVEASSWVVNRNGNIELVAQVPGVTPHSSWQTPASCSASR